jgi:hypothetical protein
MLSQVVGWLGFAWNFNRNQVWTSLGYPQDPPFNGQRMFQDTAAYANDGTVSRLTEADRDRLQHDRRMQRRSVGAWLRIHELRQWPQQLPSNSQPLEIYSPYFGENAHSLKVQVVGSLAEGSSSEGVPKNTG